MRLIAVEGGRGGSGDSVASEISLPRTAKQAGLGHDN
jgi:hypothetical protein